MLRLSSLSALLSVFLLSVVPFGNPLVLTDDVPPQTAVDECSYNQELAPVEDFTSLISISDPYMGNLDADVTVIEFFDPNCPHCATFHPIMKQVVEDSGQHAHFYMVPFPLWQYSLMQVEALFVAAQDGLYFEMLEAQYAHQKQGGMSMEELTVLASDIGLDPEIFRQRLERGLNQPQILERRKKIVDTGLRGTPSVMINGRYVASDSKSRLCLNELIAEAATAG